MGWEAIRAGAKRAVHQTFARDATYTAPGEGGAPVPARIRLHTKFLRFGDLESEGYTRVIDDVNEVVIDTDEFIPQRLGVIEFSDGRKYRIDLVIKESGERFWTCQVQPA